jgi:riboflavin biosynthesis pyrimidine reductase
MVNGGADIARQYLEAGAVEELRLHLGCWYAGRVAGGTFPNGPPREDASVGAQPRRLREARGLRISSCATA